MSGGKSHETFCTEVLYQVYFYLDGELGQPGTPKDPPASWRVCAACLREYGLEETIKGLVHKYAFERYVPVGLRAEVLRRLFGQGPADGPGRCGHCG